MNIRLAALNCSLERLRQVLHEPPSITQREASVHRFELSFGLASRCLQQVLIEHVVDGSSMQQQVELASGSDWIANEDAWLDMLYDSARVSLAYDETFSNAVYSRLPTHLEAMSAFAQRMATLP